jgi:hypothetical protein
VTVPNKEIYPPTLTYIPDNIDVGVVDTGFLEGFQLQREHTQKCRYILSPK